MRAALSTGLALALFAPAALAGTPAPVAAAPDALTYADLAGLADAAPLVIHAQVKDQATVEAERAPGLAPGHARLFVEAKTLALIAGTAPLGEGLRYLVDVPLTAEGKVPKLKKQEVLLFARPVAGRPGELQLVDAGAQLAYSPAREARLRPILKELAAADAAPALTVVRDALGVAGTLAGESETQIFLDTVTGAPVSITVARRPGQAPTWGVSWDEIVDQAARPPRSETLAWYRLACGLPDRLPGSANLADDGASRRLAAIDYAFVRQQLGPCTRTR